MFENLFKKKYNLEDYRIIDNIGCSDSRLFVNKHIETKHQFGIVIVKNKYSHKIEYQKQDLMLLSTEKLEKLCNWLLNIDKNLDDWGDSFYNDERCLVLECDCFCEHLLTSVDPENKIIYINLLDNNFYKKTWHRKFATEVYFSIKDGKDFAKRILKKLSEEKEWMLNKQI